MFVAMETFLGAKKYLERGTLGFVVLLKCLVLAQFFMPYFGNFNLECSIAIFSKPAGCAFLAFWSTIVGTLYKNVSFTFSQPFLAVSVHFQLVAT